MEIRSEILFIFKVIYDQNLNPDLLKREDKILLSRKLVFLENFQGPRIKSKAKARILFDKVREMINNDEITTMLGVESVIQHCIENMNSREKSPEGLASEMKNFVH